MNKHKNSDKNSLMKRKLKHLTQQELITLYKMSSSEIIELEKEIKDLNKKIDKYDKIMTRLIDQYMDWDKE